MEEIDKNKNFSAIKELDLAEYREGQYLIFIDGKIIKKGYAVDKLITSVRKIYPKKTPFIYRVHKRGTSIL